MLFTNKTLEIINTEEGRVVEMTNVYGHHDTMPIDKSVSDKVTYIKDNVTHKYLDIEELELKGIKTDVITLVLDSLDYKSFKCNGRFEVAESDKDKFTFAGEIKHKNRLETRTYGIDIVTINKNEEFAIGKLTMTSGLTYFVIKNKGDLVCLTYGAAIKYLKEKNIDLILKNIKFIGVKSN